MKPILRILVIILAIPLIFHTLKAQTTNPGSSPASATEIKDTEAQLEDMLLKGNWQEYSARLSVDFWQVGRELRDKQSVLADLKSGAVKYLYLTPDDEQVRSYGDAAVLNLHLSISARENGKVTTTVHRMTKVFIRQNGRWLLVSLTDVPLSR